MKSCKRKKTNKADGHFLFVYNFHRSSWVVGFFFFFGYDYFLVQGGIHHPRRFTKLDSFHYIPSILSPSTRRTKEDILNDRWRITHVVQKDMRIIRTPVMVWITNWSSRLKRSAWGGSREDPQAASGWPYFYHLKFFSPDNLTRSTLRTAWSQL